ncbi:MAG: chemotaxis protein CheW [Eubacteriales bacterium]|nr:chemotaxis protein CheW [Eubacteriales bacterium]
METMSEELLEQQENTQHGRYLTFNLGDEIYGIEIEYVTEIIGRQPITKIPEVADYIKGIINLRGKIIPVIDMRLKFKKEPIDYNDRTCTIVIDTQELIIGLIVDKVSEVISIEDEDVVPPPNQKTGICNKYIRGIGKIGGEVKLLLDCIKLFDEKEAREIETVEVK